MMNNEFYEFLEPGLLKGHSPAFFEALHQLGIRLYTANRLEDATSVAQEAIRLEPLASRHYKLMGAILQKQEQYVDAITYYSTAGNLDQMDGDIHFAAAQCFCCLKRFEDAKNALKMAQYIGRENGNATLESKSSQLLTQIDDFS